MKDILTQNQAIAYFMEWHCPDDLKPDHKRSKAHDPEYFREWDKLMKVVDKIESMGFRVVMDGNKVRIHCDKHVFKSQTIDRLQSLYYCILYFIEWYNLRTES